MEGRNRYRPASAAGINGEQAGGRRYPEGGGDSRKRPRISRDSPDRPPIRHNDRWTPASELPPQAPPPQLPPVQPVQAVSHFDDAQWPPQRIVKLNVGGQRYMTTVATLRQIRGSYLDLLFSGAVHPVLDDEGAFFVDRDGTFFMLILNFLRDGSIELPTDAVVLRALLREAKFYQLNDLLRLINEALARPITDNVPPFSPALSPSHEGGAVRENPPQERLPPAKVEVPRLPVTREPPKPVRFKSTSRCTSHYVADDALSHKIITCIDFDPTGEYLAVSMISDRISIFPFSSFLNARPGSPLESRVLPVPSKMSTISWSKGLQNRLVHGDHQGNICLWDTDRLQPIAQLTEHKKRVWSVSFASAKQHKQFASGSDDKTVKVWSIDEKSSTATLSSRAAVCCVRFSPDDNILAFSSADHNVYCYDTRKLDSPVSTLRDHLKAVWAISFLNNEELVSASVDNTIKRWNYQQAQSLLTFTGHTNKKNFTGLATGQGHLACGSEDNKVYLWHAESPDPVATYAFDENPASKFVSALCWKPGTNMIVAGNQGGDVSVFQAN